MAAYTPASHLFTYTQNSPNNPVNISVECDLQASFASITNIETLGVPSWLNIKNITVVSGATDKIQFTAEVNAIVANTLPINLYTANLTLRFQADFATIIISENFTANLDVKEGNLLSLSPSVLNFTYQIGQPLPQNKIMQLNTNYNWSITPTQTWLNASPLTGLGNASVAVSVDPSGLSVGYYEGNIVVQDQNFTRSILVKLTVTGEDTSTDFLYATPQNLEFLSEFEVVNATLKALQIEASDTWTITKNDAWIVLSASSGVAGITSINISVASEVLETGTYTAPITITMGNIVKQVFITVTVVQFFTNGLTSEALYFAKDRNKLNISSIQDNTYLQLDVSASTKDDVITYTQEVPYFKGLAKIVIGEETEVLLKSFKPSANLFSAIRNNIKPIVYQIASKNINKLTNSVSVVQGFSNISFLPGKTPVVANKLCYIPEYITITENAILSLSVLADAFPGNLVVTGAINHQISGSLANDLYVYNAILNLSNLGLVTGDVIQITFGTLVVNATIKPSQPEENIIAFENEWKEYEYFSTTGFLTKTDAIIKTTTELAVEDEKQSKIVTIDAGIDYTLNTGYIYSQQEKDWLTKILQAKRVFFYEDNDFTEIILTTTKLERYKTRENMASYNLQFKKAII